MRLFPGTSTRDKCLYQYSPHSHRYSDGLGSAASAMSPARQVSNSSLQEAALTVQEIIFSCGICQATLRDLYPPRGPSDSRSGSSDDDGLTTRLWVLTCTHITCSKHLDGGGEFIPEPRRVISVDTTQVLHSHQEMSLRKPRVQSVFGTPAIMSPETCMAFAALAKANTILQFPKSISRPRPSLSRTAIQ